MRRYVFMAVAAFISGAFSYAVFVKYLAPGSLQLWLAALAGAGVSVVLDYSQFWNNQRTWQGWRVWFNLTVGFIYTGSLAALLLQVHWAPLMYAFYLPASTFLGWLVVSVIRRVFSL